MAQGNPTTRRRFKRFILVLAGLSILIPAASQAQDPTTSRGQTVYIPVYSHIYSGDREQPFDLAVTVSIRNTDPENGLTLTSVAYYDSNGQLLKHYLEEPVDLSPLTSRRFVIAESDTLGGSGASFLVRWESNQALSPPIMESIMIGTKNQQGISFLSRGQVVRE
jgi:hypothetical protein